MVAREQDDLPYHVDLTGVAPAPTTFTRDDADYDTLTVVQTALRDGVDGLVKDFNALHIPTDKPDAEAAQILLRQIAARQMAYDILVPLLSTVDEAIALVDIKHKETR